MRSAIGIAKASVLPEPVGDFAEHVAAGEHVADHEALDCEGLGDAAAREGARNGIGHAEIGEGLR